MNQLFVSTDLAALLTIVTCLVLSAFFSSAETAITSLTALKVKHLLESKGKVALPLKLWLHKPGHVLTTILIFNNVVNILASAVATTWTTRYFQEQAIGIATGTITFLVLVFGEVIPKSFAKANAEILSMWSMKIVKFLYYSVYPLVILLSGMSEIMIRLVNGKKPQQPLITEEELEFMVSESEKAGVLGDLKKEIIESAFEFDETRVREIITPRTSLTAMDFEGSIEDAIKLTVETGHSRFPVFRENIDHIVGVVLAKDLLQAKFNPQNSAIKVREVMRKTFFAPESKTIMEVFKDLKRTKNHMAIIIDEYGGTAGIVTMEDILEEIVGDIQDEYDKEEAEIKEIGEGVFEVSGAVNIDEFLDHFEIKETELTEDEKDYEVDTLGGLMTQLIAQMPRIGQKIAFGPLKLEVIQVIRRRIEKVRVTQKASETAATT